MSIVVYLYNKRVVLVGPAPSLKDSGVTIDNYDIVVRMNSALPITEDLYKDVGYKTNVLITGLSDDYMSHMSRQTDYKDRIKDVYDTVYLPAKEKGLKYIVTWHPKMSPFSARQVKVLERINNDFEIVYIPAAIHREIRNGTGGEPNTGTMAIVYLLAFRLQELYVTGITYYADGYRKGYHPCISQKESENENFRKELQRCSGHKFDAQLKYLQRYRYPVFRPDTELRRVLKWN